MVFGGGGNQNIDITVKVDESGATSILDNLGKKIEDTGKKAEKSGDGFSSLERKIITLNQSAQLTSLAFKGFNLIIGGSIAALKKGSEVDDVSDSFENLAAKAGIASQALLNDLNNATGRTISNLQLMRESNELLQAGLDPKNFELVAKAARSFAEQTGSSTVDAFSKFNDALLRGNTTILKRIGIFADVKAAQEKLSQQTQVNIKDFNEEANLEANRIAIIDALKEKRSQLGDVEDDVADGLDQVTKAIEDQINASLRSLSSNSELTAVFSKLAIQIQNTDFSPLVTGFTSTINAAGQLILILNETVSAIQGTNKAFNDGITYIKDYTSALLTNGFNSYLADIEATSNGLNNQLTEALIKAKKAKDDLEKNKDSFGLTRLIRETDLAKEKTKDLSAAQKKYTDEVKRSARESQEFLKAKSDQDKKQLDLDRQRLKTERELQRAEEERKRAFNQVGSQALEAARKSESYQKALALVRKGELSASEAAKILTSEYNKNFESGKELADITQRMAEALEAIRTNAPDAAQKLSDVFNQQTSFDKNNPLAEAGNSATNQLGKFIQDNFEIDSGALADTIGAGLEDAINLAFDALADSLFGGGNAQNQREIDLGRKIGRGLGDAIGKYLGPIGELFGGQIGDLLGGAIGNLFGKDGKGTFARKQADAFFADLFDANRLQVIINGELSKIKDLNFGGGFASGEAFDNLRKLPEEAQAAFEGVGLAFETFLGLEEDIFGQLGAIFANNIAEGATSAGEALNNLQLLVEATGKTFDELADAIIESFLDGKIAIEDAQNALQQLQQVMEKGIPGAIGAVDIAFRNLQAAGTKGGRALLDAMRDIGVEAQELGINDFGALADFMVRTFGFSADQVRQFFEAAAAAGIRSLSQLANATQEELIAVGANLQAIQEGRAPTYTPVVRAPTSSSRSGGGSSSSASRSADEAKQKQDEAFQSLQQLIEGTVKYKEIIEAVIEGRTREVNATRQILSLYKEGEKLLKQQAKATEAYEKAVRKGKLTESILDAFTKANQAVEDFIGTVSSGQSVNESFINFISEFRNEVDLIQIGALAAGQSFKDMQTSAVNAFLAGTTSALEARKALEDSGQGIAGKRGAAGEAFQNLIDFGLKGGRLTIDALRDIGAEAEEISAKSLADLGDILSGQGINTEDAQKFFIELANQGINSLSELTKVSDEAAIKIIAGLADIKFPFKETTSETQNLLDRINQIPKSKTINITLDVDAKYGAGTKDILKRVGIDFSSYGTGKDAVGVKRGA